ncbi:hypothetical protein HDU79_006435 [Rhizoclosmatium sp. JEL0117]|nr:hypothetical protein HDU79_006435 [Rhizoclosmatium sp. JEL0117]
MFVDTANTYTKPLGKTYSPSTLDPLAGLVAFDCIGVLASGISAVMKQTSPKYVSQRKAQNLMNYTTFADSKYRGFSGDPIKLRPSADILTFETLPIEIPNAMH